MTDVNEKHKNKRQGKRSEVLKSLGRAQFRSKVEKNKKKDAKNNNYGEEKK